MNAPKKTVTRSAAWVALMTNLFVMPGVGSWMAGQRWLGVTHVGLSVLGVLMMTAWLCWFVARWIRLEQMPETGGPYAWVALTGMVIFVGTWLWSIACSVALLRAAQKQEPVPPKLET